MQTIVADSSVFIHLAPIGRVPLLQSLFGNLLVPPAVWQEVVTQGKDRPGAAELRTAVEEGWITVVSPQPEHVPSTSTVLHQGEAEAIGLAKGLPNCLLILDEAVARGVAKSLGIKVIGIVGVLVLAKRNGWYQVWQMNSKT